MLYGMFVYDSFDFGLIFELISFVFVFFAYNNLSQGILHKGKRNIIIAMIPIIWLIIYDFIDLLANLSEVTETVIEYYFYFDYTYYSIMPYLFDVTSIAGIIFLFVAYFSLCKADGSKKSDNFTDEFYDI